MCKYCSACGSELREGAKFCTACGAAVAQNAPAENPVPAESTAPAGDAIMSGVSNEAISQSVPTAPAENAAFPEQPASGGTVPPAPQGAYYPAPPSSYVPPRKSHNWLFILIAAIVIFAFGIAVLLIKVIGGASSGAYRVALDTYFQASYGVKTELVEDCAPAAFWDSIEEGFGSTVADVVENIELYVSNFDEYYGSDYDVSYVIKESERMDSDDVDDAARFLKRTYGIEKSSVTSGYELELKYTISGNLASDSSYFSCIALKIDGEWYLCDDTYDFLIFYDVPYSYDEDFDYSDYDYDYDFDFEDYDGDFSEYLF